MYFKYCLCFLKEHWVWRPTSHQGFFVLQKWCHAHLPAVPRYQGGFRKAVAGLQVSSLVNATQGWQPAAPHFGSLFCDLFFFFQPFQCQPESPEEQMGLVFVPCVEMRRIRFTFPVSHYPSVSSTKKRACSCWWLPAGGSSRGTPGLPVAPAVVGQELRSSWVSQMAAAWGRYFRKGIHQIIGSSLLGITSLGS